jgi:hypothetical protein
VPPLYIILALVICNVQLSKAKGILADLNPDATHNAIPTFNHLKSQIHLHSVHYNSSIIHFTILKSNPRVRLVTLLYLLTANDEKDDCHFLIQTFYMLILDLKNTSVTLISVRSIKCQCIINILTVMTDIACAAHLSCSWRRSISAE